MIIHSYPSIYSLGHKAICDILKGDVLVEEKVDGSQFSFAKINGALCMRSRGKEVFIDNPEKMFANAVATVKSIADNLHDE